MYDQLIKLISVKEKTDAYGDPEETREEREVFAELQSIGRQEFYQAQAVGFKPELKFKLADYLDYQGETVLLYTDERGIEDEYSIIRTYRIGNELELTCKRGIDA